MRTTALLYVATGILLLFSGQTPSLAPDTIFFGGKIVTVDPAFTIQQAFAVRGEEFLAVGTDARILPLAGPQTRKVDLHGSTVIPGLMDDHDHVYAAAMATRGRVTSPITEQEEDELILNMQKAKNVQEYVARQQTYQKSNALVPPAAPWLRPEPARSSSRLLSDSGNAFVKAIADVAGGDQGIVVRLSVGE